jgi:hypothetical protein
MSIHTIATILTLVCFGIAFICRAWLSIEENRRHIRRYEQLSGVDELALRWASLGGRK